PPPPVACTLVAFEPGSLGLELEAIVDEGAGGRVEGQAEQRRQGRRRPRRLGCRVFRVTPEGQAARHGSVHPGDALVVLDGVDVLSDPFEDITRTLLDRQGRRRLIGFMGAAAAAMGAARSSVAASVTPAPQNHWTRPPPPTPPLSPPSSSEPPGTLPAPSARARPVPATASASASDRDEREQQQGRNERGRRRRQRKEGGDRAGRRPGVGAATPRSPAGEAGRAGEVTPAGAAARRSHPHRGCSPPPTSLPPPVSSWRAGGLEGWPRVAEAEPLSAPSPDSDTTSTTMRVKHRSAGGGAAGGEEITRSRHLHDEHDRARRQKGVSDRQAPDATTKAAAPIPGGGGGGHGTAGPADTFESTRERRSGSWTGGCADFAGDFLGSSRGSSATAGFMGTAAAGGEPGAGGGRRCPARPLDGSRGESLQRSLAEAMEEKSALAAERLWLLDELQRAREATLERDGALAGQEVQTDVLRMEVGALEGELRRARQELGACKAGRRELNEAVKRDLARRDRDASDLSSALRRERSARERDADMSRVSFLYRMIYAQGRNAQADIRVKSGGGERSNGPGCDFEPGGGWDDVSQLVSSQRDLCFVREREEEISALLLRVSASDSHLSYKATETKAPRSPTTEVEEAAIKSLEVAERRRVEWEERASAVAARLREREKDRAVKDLEARLSRARSHASEVEDKGASELRRVVGELQTMRKEFGEKEVRARVEADRLAQRLRDEEKKASANTARLRALEQRARFAETGAVAARQRAEAGTRKEKEVTERLMEVETERACQEVAVTTLKAQVRSSLGLLWLRFTLLCQELLALQANTTQTSTGYLTRRAGGDGRRHGRPGAALEEAVRAAAATSGLVELARELQGRTAGLGRELEAARRDLATARRDNTALRQREEDEAELRSLLEQKRGVSDKKRAIPPRGTNKGMENHEDEAGTIALVRTSPRAELEAVVEQGKKHEERAEGLQRDLETEALAARLSEAEAAASRASADLRAAAGRVSPLQEALSAADAEKAEILKRLTRREGEYVLLHSRLEETLAELEAVKVALFGVSYDSCAWGGEDGASARTRDVEPASCALAALVADLVIVGIGTSHSETSALRRQHAEAREESRSARSELACIHLRTRMCGARVLSGVLRKWVARQTARGFWRLR
ncbi:unnamed protein product, partial [Scytosiphon promiscuus]